MFYAVFGREMVKLQAANMEEAMKEISKMDNKPNIDQPVRIMHVVGDVQPEPEKVKKDAEYYREWYDLGGEG